MRVQRTICALVIILSSSTARAELELKNDSFDSGEMVVTQDGFDPGEIAASRFIAPDAGRQLLKVQLVYASTTGDVQRTITLKVYDDTAGTATPGSELFSGDYTLTSSASALQELTLTETVIVPAQFRIGVVTMDAMEPSVAADFGDGQMAGRNYLFANNGGWNTSAAYGVTGDWIMRAFVSDNGGGGGDGGGGDGGTTGAACNSNPECPAGQFCDLTAHACTLECRISADCGGGGTCNSLGMCIGGDDSGCCDTNRSGPIGGVIMLGLGVLALIRRRRR